MIYNYLKISPKKMGTNGGEEQVVEESYPKKRICFGLEPGSSNHWSHHPCLMPS